MHVQNIALAATLALLPACAGADAQLTCVLTGQCVRSPAERAADNRAEAAELAAQKDAAERRRLVARQATLRDQLANQRLTVNRLRREVAEQQGRLGASETRLAAVSAELSQVAVVEPEFLLMGEVTCMEPSGAMCVRGNVLHTGGPTIDRPMFPAFILLDPQPGDVLGGRIVSAKHVHFRGYHKGVNGFGGPITGVVVSHAVPTPKRGDATAQRIAKLRSELSTLEPRVAPLTRAKASLVASESELRRLEAEVESTDGRLARLPPESVGP